MFSDKKLYKIKEQVAKYRMVIELMDCLKIFRGGIKDGVAKGI